MWRQAASDKIEREIEMFGENFERFVPDGDVNPAAATTATDGPAKPADKTKKGKVAAKAPGLQYQFQIMESMGVPREEIKKFADPYYWLKYYPPICIVSVRSLNIMRFGMFAPNADSSGQVAMKSRRG